MTKSARIIRMIVSWLASIAFAGAAIYAPELAVAFLPPRG
jgi:hypothetical protein